LYEKLCNKLINQSSRDSDSYIQLNDVRLNDVRLNDVRLNKVEGDADPGFNDDEDFVDQITNFIIKENNTAERNPAPVRNTDYLIDELQSEKNKKAIRANMAEEDLNYKKLDQKKYDARAGLKAHDDKLSQIYSEEKRLLSQGLDPEVVRRKVREMFYPEAIPANERKTPKVTVTVLDADGNPRPKSVSLLAFNEDYLEDDDEDTDDTERDLPDIDNPDDIVDEKLLA
jgi:hypothetical protein